MSITLDGSGGISSTGGIDAADLTGALPALDGSNLTTLPAGNLTGVLPAIDGSALTGVTGSAPTTTQVMTAFAGQTPLGVGSHAILQSTSTNTAWSAGGTVAGSALRQVNFYRDGNSTSSLYRVGSYGATVSGTWKAMAIAYGSGSYYTTSLFLRIS